MRRTLPDRLALAALFVLGSATAACTADTRPTADAFEMRDRGGFEEDELVAEDDDVVGPAGNADRARLSAERSIASLAASETVTPTR